MNYNFNKRQNSLL